MNTTESLSEYVAANLPHLKKVKRVNRYTRAGRNGKEITCPKCNHTEKVYHFAWSAAGCLGCREYINKEDFLVNV